jgi:hypothetical protein
MGGRGSGCGEGGGVVDMHTYQPLQRKNLDLRPNFKGGFVFSQEVLVANQNIMKL